MRLTPETGRIDLAGKRLLIFIVAYNAEKTITQVLARIPGCLRQPGVEVLIIDDSSSDKTFSVGRTTEVEGIKLTVLRNPVNQGYGGNQKLGYRYAIDHGFDVVALVHGDGQYAPEKLPELLQPLLDGKADAVFGSRMMIPGAARRGGMPPYKYIGNRILTAVQNRLLGSHLSEFHSGYRLYTVNALRQIPFERNTGDFHFDTEIIVQLHLRGLRIYECPIPTYYGDEICHVNGMKYAWNVIRTTFRVRLHQLNLLYDRKFEVGRLEEKYTLKLGYHSSHTVSLASLRPGARVLDLGCGEGYWAEEAAKKDTQVTGIDQFAPVAAHSPGGVCYLRADLDSANLPVSPDGFDQIFMLDIIEHLKDPEAFMENLRDATGRRRPEVVLTTANIGFLVTRLMLLFGQFNYGRKGILDRTHTRLFTFQTLRNLMEETGYQVEEMRGIPVPIPAAIGLNFVSRTLLLVNRMLIRISRGMFSYQIYLRARAVPTISHLLGETLDASSDLAKKSEVSA
ncbi:MAG: glycosyltransferase [Armatimonadetes bacterium]|nr:glycosyltransferase [Akkermansiaceae bacterium]